MEAKDESRCRFFDGADQGYPCTKWIYSMPFGGDPGETPFLRFVKVEVKSYQT